MDNHNGIPVQANFSLMNMSIRGRVDWLLIEWPSYIVGLLPKISNSIQSAITLNKQVH